MSALLSIPYPDGAPSPLAVLEAGLAELRRRPVSIVAGSFTPLDSFSTHPIYRLEVTLADGERLSVIFKRIQPGEDADVRRHHEVLIYRRLLKGTRYGAPELYASYRDPDRGLYWLFLEDVGSWRLDYCEMPEWHAAFRWLARMHAGWIGRQHDLIALDCLNRHDETFYRYLAGAARTTLAERGEPSALARFDAAIEHYDAVVRVLLNQPQGLLHGDMDCHNLMLQPGGRIRAVDWEWAAIGVPAWDVAKLLAGWGSHKPLLVTTYLDELAGAMARPVDCRAFQQALACCEALNALWYLRWWTRACEEPAFVARLLQKIDSTGQEMRGSANG